MSRANVLLLKNATALRAIGPRVVCFDLVSTALSPCTAAANSFHGEASWSDSVPSNGTTACLSAYSNHKALFVLIITVTLLLFIFFTNDPS